MPSNNGDRVTIQIEARNDLPEEQFTISHQTAMQLASALCQFFSNTSAPHVRIDTGAIHVFD